MVILNCVILLGDGEPFPVSVDGEDTLYMLEAAIKRKKPDAVVCEAYKLQLFLGKMDDGKWLDAAGAATLTFHRNGSPRGFKQMDNPLLRVNDASYFGAGFEPEEGGVHVLVVLPVDTTTWRLVSRSCPPLSYDQDGAFIHIPEAYAEGSGLHVGQQGLLLLRRNSLHEEWLALLDGAVSTYAVTWVVGPPGTGKSCAAFAFACSLDRSEGWDVVWISCLRPGPCSTLECIRFRGDSIKEACLIDRTQLNELLLSLDEKAIVFFNDYEVDNDSATMALATCRGWQYDEENRRLVIVSSMLSTGKEYRLDLSINIPSVVSSGLTSKAVVSPTAPVKPGFVLDEQRVRMASWTLEEFQEAVKSDVFFEHVRRNFTSSSEYLSLDQRNGLVAAKFFVVGGSARMMFDIGRDTAEGALVDAVCYSSADIFSSNDLLLSWLPPLRSADWSSPGIVSAFVARELAFRLIFVERLEKLLDLVLRLLQNRSTGGNALVMWFFASLNSLGAVLYSTKQGHIFDVWKGGNASSFGLLPRFGPEGDIPVDRGQQWLVPTSWNYGGYDAVFIELCDLDVTDIQAREAGYTSKMLLRFVQVVSSMEHFFLVDYFKDLLTRLMTQFHNSVWIYRVEVCFVVRIDVMEDFQLPIDELDFRRGALEAAVVSDLPTVLSVQALGMKYELLDEEEVAIKRLRRF